MRTLALAACLSLMSAACPKEAPPPPPPPVEVKPVINTAPVDVVTASADDRKCETDAECTLVTVDCCGCESLGAQTGVRKDKLESLASRRTPVCGGMVCAQAMSREPSCGATAAVCREGYCVPNVGKAALPPGVLVEPIK